MHTLVLYNATSAHSADSGEAKRDTTGVKNNKIISKNSRDGTITLFDFDIILLHIYDISLKQTIHEGRCKIYIYIYTIYVYYVKNNGTQLKNDISFTKLNMLGNPVYSRI